MAAVSSALSTGSAGRRKRKGKALGLSLNTQQAMDNVPTKVCDKLYFGSLHAAFNEVGLVERGITHVLNLSGMQPTFASRFSYLNVDIKDKDSSDILSVIPLSLIFINAGMSAGGTFVHWCGFRFLKNKRSVVEPNKGAPEMAGPAAGGAAHCTAPRPPLLAGFELQLRAYRESKYHIYSAQQILLYRKLAAAVAVKRRRNDARQVTVRHAEFAGMEPPQEAPPTAEVDTPGSSALPTAAPITPAPTLSPAGRTLRRLHTQPTLPTPSTQRTGEGPSPLPSSRSATSTVVPPLARSLVATMQLTAVDQAVATVRRMAHFTLSHPGQTRAVVIPPLMGMQWRFRCQACDHALFLASSVVRPSTASAAGRWTEKPTPSRVQRPLTARSSKRVFEDDAVDGRARTGSGGQTTTAAAQRALQAVRAPHGADTSPRRAVSVEDEAGACLEAPPRPKAGRRAAGGVISAPPSLHVARSPTELAGPTILSPVLEGALASSTSPKDMDTATGIDLSDSGDALGALLAAAPTSPAKPPPVTPRTAAAQRSQLGGAGASVLAASPPTPRTEPVLSPASATATAEAAVVAGSASARVASPEVAPGPKALGRGQPASFHVPSGGAAGSTPSLAPTPAWSSGAPPSTRHSAKPGAFTFGLDTAEEGAAATSVTASREASEEYDPWALAADGAPQTPSGMRRKGGLTFATSPKAPSPPGPKDVFGNRISTAAPTDYSKRSGWKSTVVFDKGEQWSDADKRSVSSVLAGSERESYRQRLQLLAALTFSPPPIRDSSSSSEESPDEPAVHSATPLSAPTAGVEDDSGIEHLTRRRRPSTATRRRVTESSQVVDADVESSAFAVGGDVVFLEPLDWMGEMPGQHGKLLCPGCSAHLGFYDWAGAIVGSQCRVSPAFCVYAAAVWVQKPSAAPRLQLTPSAPAEAATGGGHSAAEAPSLSMPALSMG
ncbi:mpl1 [Symbiodinium sp. KB8]|nr:mpl1 [Symbiodinium sp. KB8]